MNNLKQTEEIVFSVKLWGSRLHGKIPAIRLRSLLIRKLSEDIPLQINMAGVKQITPGFARECFGLLYLVAVQNNCTIYFSHTPKEIRPILLQGIASAIKPRYEKEIS